jgi:transcriptional regulator with XRE-family HTH domain
MESEELHPRPGRGTEQRIGPALRAVRLREGRTLDEVAASCGVKASLISSIEKGRSQVSFPLMLRLASVLDVDPKYFASFQEASAQIEKDLKDLLTRIELPATAIPALLALSVEAQGALVDGLRWLMLVRDGRPIHENEIEQQIVNFGVEASLSYILAGTAEFGVDASGFGRMLTQMEELSGDRLVMSDRLMTITTPNGGQIDPLDVFRSIFRAEPQNPALIRLWAKTLGSAVRESVQHHESRTIYPLASICAYIDTGHWGHGVDVGTDRIEQHIGALIRTLRSTPNFRVGFIDEDIPFNLLVKGNLQAMSYIRQGPEIFHGQSHGIAFRYSRPDVVWRFREYFDALWERIPDERKDSDAIAGWLEQRVMTAR